MENKRQGLSIKTKILLAALAVALVGGAVAVTTYTLAGLEHSTAVTDSAGVCLGGLVWQDYPKPKMASYQ